MKQENALAVLAKEPGFAVLSAFAQECDRIEEKLEKVGSRPILPNFYCAIDNGFDFEPFLGALARTLDTKNLMDFTGPVPYYVFDLAYSEPHDPRFFSFAELYDVIATKLSRFSHPYGGVLAIDITDWVVRGATNEKKFLDFLSYMADIDEKTMAVFLDCSGEAAKSQNAFQTILSKTRLERLEFHITEKEGILILEDMLAKSNFKLEKKAREELEKTLKAALATKGSEGFKTIRQLAEDIIYYAFTKEGELDTELSLSDIAPFAENGEWIANYAAKKSFLVGLLG